MERTSEFLDIVVSHEAETGLNTRITAIYAPQSLFIIRANELHQKVEKFTKLMASQFISYVGYHRHLSSQMNRQAQSSKFMTSEEAYQLNQQVILFVTSLGAEVQDLQRSIINQDPKPSKDALEHFNEIIICIKEELSCFTKLTQRMQSERDRLKDDEDPFLMMTHRHNRNKFFAVSHVSPAKAEQQEQAIEFPFRTDSDPQRHDDVAGKEREGKGKDKDKGKDTGKDNDKDKEKDKDHERGRVVPAHFHQRFVDEMATAKQMQTYTQFSEKYKQQLLKEANILQTRFSEEMLCAQQMESNVTAISQMLTQFVGLLEEQTDVVDVVHDLAKDTTELVKDADEELCLTLERSNKHSRNMLIIIAGLSVLLLLLDFLTS